MSWSQYGTGVTAQAAGSTATTGSYSLAGANLLVGISGHYQGGDPLFKDSTDGATGWNGLTVSHLTNVYSRMWWKYYSTPVPGALTFSVDSGGNFVGLAALGFSGSSSTPYNSKEAQSQRAGTNTIPCGPVDTSPEDGQLVVLGGAGFFPASAVDLGFTVQVSGLNSSGVAIWLATLVQSTHGSITPTATLAGTDGDHCATMASFRVNAAGILVRSNQLIIPSSQAVNRSYFY